MKRQFAAVLLLLWSASSVQAQPRSPYDPAVQPNYQLEYQVLTKQVEALNATIAQRINETSAAIKAAAANITSAKCSEAEDQVNNAILKLDDLRQQQVSVMLKDSANPVQHMWADIAKTNIRLIDNFIAGALVAVADASFKGNCVDVADHYYRAVIASGNAPADFIRRAQIGIDDVRARRAPAK
jgi:hypothetical protein